MLTMFTPVSYVIFSILHTCLVMRVGIVFSNMVIIDNSSILILNRNYKTIISGLDIGNLRNLDKCWFVYVVNFEVLWLFTI